MTANIVKATVTFDKIVCNILFIHNEKTNEGDRLNGDVLYNSFRSLNMFSSENKLYEKT